MEQVRIYRTCVGVRLAVLAAAAVWAAMLGLLARLPSVAPQSRLSAAAFLVFFALFSMYYGRLAIAVTGEGIVVSRFLRRLLPVPFEDILGIEVRKALGGTFYDVLTRRGLVRFSSLLARHRELFRLILEKADLERRG